MKPLQPLTGAVPYINVATHAGPRRPCRGGGVFIFHVQLTMHFVLSANSGPYVLAVM